MTKDSLAQLGIDIGDAPPAREASWPSDTLRNPKGKPPAGKPGWERFVVSRRSVSQPWPDTDRAAIRQARQLHDEGSHTMVQETTKEGWNILYCVPRRQPVQPAHTPYFLGAI